MARDLDRAQWRGQRPWFEIWFACVLDAGRRRALWVRCARRYHTALTVTDLLVHCPGFAVVALVKLWGVWPLAFVTQRMRVWTRAATA